MFKSIKKELLILLLLLIGIESKAQNYTLEQCLQMADTANLTLRNARLDVMINSKERDAYLTSRLPHLMLNSDYKYNAKIPQQLIPAEFSGGAPGTFSTVQFGVPINLSNTLTLNQILFDPRVNYGIQTLKIQNDITKVQSKIVEQDIKFQVSDTYFKLQGLNKQLEFIKSNQLNMDQLIKNMQALVDQKMVIPTELDKLKINRFSLDNSEATTLSIKEQLTLYMKILIGLKTEQLFDVSKAESVEKSVISKPDSTHYLELDILKSQSQLNREEKKSIKMSYLPSLSFYTAYNYTYNIDLDNDFRKGIDGAFIGIRMDWTLFDGLEKHHKLKAAKITSEKLTFQEELTRQQLEMQTVNAKNQINVQSSNLNTSVEKLKLAQKIYDVASANFSQGIVGSNDLIIATNELEQAQINVITNYIQLRQAEITFLKTISAL